MNIVVNGKPMQTAAGSTLADLLNELRLDSRQVVIERNQAIVPHQRFADELLADGDSLEIVHFVGGG